MDSVSNICRNWYFTNNAWFDKQKQLVAGESMEYIIIFKAICIILGIGIIAYGIKLATKKEGINAVLSIRRRSSFEKIIISVFGEKAHRILVTVLFLAYVVFIGGICILLPFFT